MTSGGLTSDEAWALQVQARAEELLEAGYDNGFGVTSLDTLLCEQMRGDERLDFACWLIVTLEAQQTEMECKTDE